MTQFFTYIFRDPSRNSEAIYVGKGCGPRPQRHFNRTDKHPFTQRLQLMKANGVEPHIEIINAIDEDHAYFMEECCIQVLGRKDLGKGALLNLNDGGKGGMSNPSAETRRRMSDGNKGENHPNFGMPRSDETKNRQSEALKGVPKPRVTCPHCGTEGGAGVMSRYHFDKCKHKKVS